MVKKTIFLLVLYIFLQFYLSSLGEKNILPNLTNSQEPKPVFWPLGAGAARKKYQESEPPVAAWGKKSEAGAGAASKKVRSRSS